MKTKLNALSAWLDRHALLLGTALAAALSLLLALYNVGGGPLGNLNDIGGWRNRALYIALTAAVQLFVLLAAALLYHERFWRLAVRQLLLTVGLVILLMGVNHKSYLFVEQMLPFIRRMDAAGLSAMNDMRLNLSAPAVTALYLLTRGPIYDMYMLKLACMGAFLLMAVLAAHAADRRGWGLRGEALLLLCLILPQGFLTAGSAPQIDALGALLLVAALTLLDEKHPQGGMLLYGAAFALSGAAFAMSVWNCISLRYVSQSSAVSSSPFRCLSSSAVMVFCESLVDVVNRFLNPSSTDSISPILIPSCCAASTADVLNASKTIS